MQGSGRCRTSHTEQILTLTINQSSHEEVVTISQRNLAGYSAGSFPY
jgi:hypothetical protein